MEQSHLLELIRTLSPEEMDEIRLFSTLPAFNHGKMKTQVPLLLDICMSYSLNAEQQALEKRDVFSKLFPNQAFLEGKLEKVMVEAHKVVRTFLTVQHYLRKENEFQFNLDFSEVVHTRGLEVRYQQMLAKMRRLQEESPFRHENYFYHQFLVEYAIHNKESRHNQLKGDLNVPNVIFALELHSHLNRLALLNRFLLQQKVAKLVVPETIKAILEENHVPNRYLEASVSIRVNFEIFKLLKKESLESLDAQALFDLLLLYEEELDPDSLRGFYTYLRNICVLIFNMDTQNEAINYTLHELYKDNLMRGYLHYEGKLHSGTYLGVCNNALWVKNYDWALDFIERYKHQIIDENATQDFYRFNLANYLFARGQFAECLDNIPETSTSVIYLLQGKRLEIKALYELESDLFSYRLDNFKMFLIRTSPKLLSENQRQKNVDFANILSQITNSAPGDNRRSDLLVKRIEMKKQVADWRWLLEKAKAIKTS